MGAAATFDNTWDGTNVPGRWDRSSPRPLGLSAQTGYRIGRAEGWQRSVYLDEMNRDHTIRFDEVAPLGTGAGRPDPKRIHDILFVIDTTHAKPGSSGRIWVSSAALQR